MICWGVQESGRSMPRYDVLQRRLSERRPAARRAAAAAAASRAACSGGLLRRTPIAHSSSDRGVGARGGVGLEAREARTTLARCPLACRATKPFTHTETPNPCQLSPRPARSAPGERQQQKNQLEGHLSGFQLLRRIACANCVLGRPRRALRTLVCHAVQAPLFARGPAVGEQHAADIQPEC